MHGLSEVTAEPHGLLKETVAARLREEILQGRLSPGEKIVEGRWAHELGVAQISVREALNILAQEGFVTKGHGRSARVLKLKRDDIIHLYQLRGALEGLGARLVVEQKLPLEDFEAILDEMRTCVSINDLPGAIDCVEQFHVALLEKPGNTFLREDGRRIVIPLYAFTRMRALAHAPNILPWIPHLACLKQILQAMHTGNAFFAEQMVVQINLKFLKSALKAWALGHHS